MKALVFTALVFAGSIASAATAEFSDLTVKLRNALNQAEIKTIWDIDEVISSAALEVGWDGIDGWDQEGNPVASFKSEWLSTGTYVICNKEKITSHDPTFYDVSTLDVDFDKNPLTGRYCVLVTTTQLADAGVSVFIEPYAPPVIDRPYVGYGVREISNQTRIFSNLLPQKQQVECILYGILAAYPDSSIKYDGVQSVPVTASPDAEAAIAANCAANNK